MFIELNYDEMLKIEGGNLWKILGGGLVVIGGIIDVAVAPGCGAKAVGVVVIIGGIYMIADGIES